MSIRSCVIHYVLQHRQLCLYANTLWADRRSLTGVFVLVVKGPLGEWDRANGKQSTANCDASLFRTQTNTLIRWPVMNSKFHSKSGWLNWDNRARTNWISVLSNKEALFFLLLLPKTVGYCGFSPWQPRWTALVGERAWSKSRPSLKASQWARKHWAALFPPTGRFCGFCRWAAPLVSAHTTAWSSFWESRGSEWNKDGFLGLQDRLVSSKCNRRYWGTMNQQF